MKKTRKESRIEIWSSAYINLPENRKPEDQKADIIQIEPISGQDGFIVEVIG